MSGHSLASARSPLRIDSRIGSSWRLQSTPSKPPSSVTLVRRDTEEGVVGHRVSRSSRRVGPLPGPRTTTSTLSEAHDMLLRSHDPDDRSP